MRRWSLALGAALILAGRVSAGADTGTRAYRAMGIEPRDVLSGTVLTAQVLPALDKQVVALVTHLTGKRGEADAVNVRLAVFAQDAKEGRLVPLYSRDLGAENGGYVGRGDLEIVDLDGDGVSEIVVTYDSLKNRLIHERRGEVIVHDETGFRVGWSGALEYDATRAARDLPAERRDRFTRRIDVPSTVKARGLTLFLSRTTIAVAGERLAEPRVSKEAFPLRSAAGGF